MFTTQQWESDLKSRLSRYIKVKSHHEVIQRRNNGQEYQRSYKLTIQQNLHYFFDVLALHSKEMCPFLASVANIYFKPYKTGQCMLTCKNNSLSLLVLSQNNTGSTYMCIRLHRNFKVFTLHQQSSILNSALTIGD